MTKSERIAALEAAIQRLEARIQILETRPIVWPTVPQGPYRDPYRWHPTWGEDSTGTARVIPCDAPADSEYVLSVW